jgi:hypothetical protein
MLESNDAIHDYLKKLWLKETLEKARWLRVLDD